MPPTTLAIVIVSYNVRDLLRACLAATDASLAHSPELEATTWVIDNASVDGSPAMVKVEFPQVRLIESHRNLGFAGGNNLVLERLGFVRHGGMTTARLTQPDLVLLLNADAEPLADSIGRLACFLREHPSAGGAGAQLRYPDGRFQHGAFYFPGLWQLWFDLFPPRPRRLLNSRLNGRYSRRAYLSGHPFPVDFVLGATLMVRREAIQATGLLDDAYFMYAEEVDWCWRMRRTGWPFYCVPSACVIHHAGASTQQFRARSMLNLWLSRRRLYDRFYAPWRRRLAGAIVRLAMWRERRRLRSAAASGGLPAAEAAERLITAQKVADVFASRRRT